MVTLHQTWSDFREDLARRRTLEGWPPGAFPTLKLFSKAGVLVVMLYRLSRWASQNRLRVLVRPLAAVNYFLTRCEISAHADLGPGLVVADCGLVGITGVIVAGRNCTFLGRNTLTLGAMEGFDLAHERIRLGDHCVLGPGARVMRPVTLAAATQVKANSVVLTSMERTGSTVAGVPAKRRALDDYHQIIRWNPLYGGFLPEA